MRKVTQQAVNAFNQGNDFKSSNTRVVATGNVVMMYLHGNQIAKRVLTDFNADQWELSISACGWLTNTTKERLNGLDNVSIQQKAWQWYLNGQKWNGELITVK